MVYISCVYPVSAFKMYVHTEVSPQCETCFMCHLCEIKFWSWILKIHSTACKVSVENENTSCYCLFQINCVRVSAELYTWGIPTGKSPEFLNLVTEVTSQNLQICFRTLVSKGFLLKTQHTCMRPHVILLEPGLTDYQHSNASERNKAIVQHIRATRILFVHILSKWKRMSLKKGCLKCLILKNVCISWS
jgi:hypothetical protein